MDYIQSGSEGCGRSSFEDCDDQSVVISCAMPRESTVGTELVNFSGKTRVSRTKLVNSCVQRAVRQ